jgi:hypothetical protein
MVIVGLLGLVIAIVGFGSGHEYGQFEAWILATPGIAVVGYALVRLTKEIEHLESDTKAENNHPDT